MVGLRSHFRSGVALPTLVSLSSVPVRLKGSAPQSVQPKVPGANFGEGIAPKSPHTMRSLSQPRRRHAGERPTIAGKVPKSPCLGIPVVGSTSGIYFFQPALHGANRGYGAMNYQALANDGLTLLYETIRAALKADDSLTSGGDEPRFRIRDTGEWRKLAADLETEMIKRGMMFEVIEWDAGQIKLPLGD